MFARELRKPVDLLLCICFIPIRREQDNRARISCIQSELADTLLGGYCILQLARI